MRHGKKFNHLGRKTAHRKAMLSNMAGSLIEHKRVMTTVQKAKALRKVVEPLVTRSKENTTHNRRIAFAVLRQKEVVTELFNVVGPKVGDRPGGYTRIIKTGNRQGDNAEMCMIELVDFNDIYGGSEKKTKTRRSRRGGAKKVADAATEIAADVKDAASDAAEAVADAASDAAEEVKNVAEDIKNKVDGDDAADDKKEA